MTKKKSLVLGILLGALSLSCCANNNLLNLRVYNETTSTLAYQSFQASDCSATVNSAVFQHEIHPGQSALIPISLLKGSYLSGTLNFADSKTGAMVAEKVMDPSILYAGAASFQSSTAGYTSTTLAEEHYRNNSTNRLEVPYANISVAR